MWCCLHYVFVRIFLTRIKVYISLFFHIVMAGIKSLSLCNINQSVRTSTVRIFSFHSSMHVDYHIQIIMNMRCEKKWWFTVFYDVCQVDNNLINMINLFYLNGNHLSFIYFILLLLQTSKDMGNTRPQKSAFAGSGRRESDCCTIRGSKGKGLVE